MMTKQPNLVPKVFTLAIDLPEGATGVDVARALENTASSLRTLREGTLRIESHGVYQMP